MLSKTGFINIRICCKRIQREVNFLKTNQISSDTAKWINNGNLSKLYINGRWVDPVEKEYLNVKNPATNEKIAEVGIASERDVEDAIQAAKTAFNSGPWKNTSAHERSLLLNKIANEIEKNIELLKEVETWDNGKTLSESKADIEGAVDTFRYYASIVLMPMGETLTVEKPLVSKVVREPVGVCGQIIPWNYPLLMAAWKLAPALAVGNTCILKPSEVTPLSSICLFEILDVLNIPPGVVNLINGYGDVAGQHLVESENVDKIAFTGGTETGKKILQSSVGNLKKVSLELGGKSANIVFSDADYQTALDHAAFAIFNNSGEVCSAGSRLLLQREIYDEFLKDLVEITKNIKVGNGFKNSTQMGPLVNQQQLRKVKSYVELGKEEAKLMCGGNQIIEDGFELGNFFEPTIFSDADPKSRIAQEEVFGPVLTVIPFDTEEEAINIANDSNYGLAAGIFTSDGAKGERVSNELRVGVTWINTFEQNLIEGPWGGYKQSGIGRELGVYALQEYTEVKQMINNLQVEPTYFFD